MTIFVPKSPSGYTLFCDDVRQENNGKLLYIGVYQGAMLIAGGMPATLPSFCAVVTYMERPGQQDGPVTLKVFVPGEADAIFEADLPVDELRSANIDVDKNEDPIIMMNMTIRLSPFIILEEGLIRIRAYAGDDEIRLGTLKVRLNSVD